MNLPSLTHKRHTDPLSVLQAQTVGIVSAYHLGKLTDDEYDVAIGDELETAREAIRETVQLTRVQTQEVLSDPAERRAVGLTTANLLRELRLDDVREGRKGDE